MDYSLAFGVGRQTAWRVEDITQPLVTEEDMRGPISDSPAKGGSTRPPVDPSKPRPVFPYAAKMMLSYGPLINMLNREQGGSPGQYEADISNARMGAIRLYNQLPQDMQWNVGK